jgi:chemotaxis protein MotB
VFRVAVLALLGLLGVVQTGCVTQAVFDEASQAREALAAEVERLRIERDSLEEQYYDAQEAYEDERITRTGLTRHLADVEKRASELDETLAAERKARIAAATALETREAQLSSMQSTYDELVTDLESEVSSGQIEIERLREGLRLNVSDEVLFATGSAKLDSIGREVLVKVAGQLAGLSDFIEVRGHTDDRAIHGSLAKRYPSNWELAAARAARVVRLLEAEGVAASRLAAVSLGANDPLVENDTPENRALNRRIEIRLLPAGTSNLASEPVALAPESDSR